MATTSTRFGSSPRTTSASPGAGNREQGGIEAFLDIYRAHIRRGFVVCQHAVTNVIASRDGDLIRTSAYFQVRLFREEGTRS